MGGLFAGAGAGNRNRTYDLIITNDALYQLSYSGEPRILGGMGLWVKGQASVAAGPGRGVPTFDAGCMTT